MRSKMLWASALTLIAQAAAAQEVTVLDVLVLGESRFEGEKLGEFSALLADPATGRLIGVSDRGYLAWLVAELSGDRIAGLTPTALYPLTAPEAAALDPDSFNPEGAALLPDGTIAIVSEAGPRLAVFSPEGEWLRDEDLPAPLRDAALQSSEKDGIEALAWSDTAGFLAITEEPQLGQDRDTHTLHATQGGAAAFTTIGPESLSIKAMEIDGARLLLLTRLRDDVTDALRPVLWVANAATCPMAGDCTGAQVEIPVPGITDADFEGLAALGDGRFLMVSDDRIDGDLRSVFVLFRLD